MVTSRPAFGIQVPVSKPHALAQNFSGRFWVQRHFVSMYVLRVQVWYDPNDVFDAWDLYLAAAEADDTLMQNKLFRYSILQLWYDLPYIVKIVDSVSLILYRWRHRYDFADVSRQGMQIAAIQFYDDMIKYYKKGEVNPTL